MTKATMSAREIISKYCKGKLLADAGYYSGRGNNNGDLNSDMIEAVYAGIKNEVGANAAKAFVNMVGEMTTDASATTFLVSLFRLEINGWKFNPSAMPTETDAMAEALADTQRQSGEESVFAVSFGMFGSLLGRSGETAQPGDGLVITRKFLDRHASELDKPIPTFDLYRRSPYDARKF